MDREEKSGQVNNFFVACRIWKIMKQILFTILVSFLTIAICSAQENANKKLKDLDEKQVNCIDTSCFKRWLEKDVPYIITLEEKAVFHALKTAEERENFIENFWRRRDPTPGTEENEFRDEHYERIKYANDYFGRGTPGWMTDRGLIYILFGKPEKIESERRDFAGLRNIPFEKWSYKNLNGSGSAIEFDFIDLLGNKDFLLPKETREKILSKSGAGLTICLMCPQ